MGRLFANRYLDALAKTMLVFGVMHITVLTYAAVRGRLDALNAFYIVSLDLIIPGVEKGLASFLLSYVMVLAVYVVFRFLLSHSRPDERP